MHLCFPSWNAIREKAEWLVQGCELGQGVKLCLGAAGSGVRLGVGSCVGVLGAGSPGVCRGWRRDKELSALGEMGFGSSRQGPYCTVWLRRRREGLKIWPRRWQMNLWVVAALVLSE